MTPEEGNLWVGASITGPDPKRDLYMQELWCKVAHVAMQNLYGHYNGKLQEANIGKTLRDIVHYPLMITARFGMN